MARVGRGELEGSQKYRLGRRLCGQVSDSSTGEWNAHTFKKKKCFVGGKLEKEPKLLEGNEASAFSRPILDFR